MKRIFFLLLIISGSVYGQNRDFLLKNGVIATGKLYDSAAIKAALDLKGNITSQTFVTPNIGIATATSINKVVITQPATSATLTIPDGVTLNAGAGGTLGSNAFTSTAYAPINNATFTGTFATAAGAIGNAALANSAVANLSGTNTGDQTTVSGNAGTATALATSRNLWGQAFDGTAAVTGSLTSVGDITGGASNMIIQSGTGASRTMVLKTTTAGSTATTALTLAADQSATFANTVNATTFVGALTGTASGNLVSGGALGTPSSGTATNLTGTAAGLTAGNVTTNANLTGDVTSSGNATTLATVASAGTTGSSTAIPVITINAKGLTTTITTAAVVAPAGTLSGATLASGVTASSLTSVGTLASPTLTTPVINGLATGTGVTSAATASTIATRDANGNLSNVNIIEGWTTTATAAGTTTMVIGDNFQQFWTGSTTQTVKLPTTGVVAGQQWQITNNSTGLVTVQSSGANTILILAGSTSAVFTAIIATPTTAANWNYSYAGDVVTSGKKLSVSNTLTLAGTDGTTMTFPTTNATIARTDAANTFTGVQTLSSSPILSSGAVTVSGNAVTFPTSVSTLAILGANTFTGGQTFTAAAPQLTLGANAATLGSVKMFGNTSGDATIQPTAVAGTATVQTLPATTGTLVNRVTTAAGVSASNSDGALTFALGAITPTTVNGNTITTGTGILTIAAGKTLTASNSLTLAGTDATTMTFPATNATVSRDDGAGALTSATSAIANTETKIFSSDASMAANRLVAGTSFEVILHGTCTSTAAGVGIIRVRYGTAGTTSDGVMQSFTLAAAAVSGTAVPFTARMIITVRTNGASATSFGGLDLVNNGTTGLSTTATQVVSGSASTIATATAATFFTVTYISGNASTATTFQDGVLTILNK